MKLYTKRYQVRPNEADAQNHLKTVAALDYLQDMAWEHASRLGLSVDQLLARNLTWVLARLHVRQLRPVRQGETLSVDTWPVGVHRLYAIRDFRALDEAGEPVLLATSGWLILQVPGFRPLRPDPYLEDVETVDDRALVDSFRALPRLSEAAASPPAEFVVRWHDLDINRHVNNTVYPRWALEALPRDVLNTAWCREIEIHFVGMANDGDAVRVRHAPLDASDSRTRSFAHQILLAHSGKPCTHLVTRWGEL